MSNFAKLLKKPNYKIGFKFDFTITIKKIVIV